MTEFPVPTPNSWPSGITAGPDGALWFTERIEFKIGKITTSGIITEYPLPTVAGYPTSIVGGPDGALWFVETFANKIGRITTAGVITEFSIPTPNSQPNGITAGPDGALWFTELIGNKIGRITTAGVINELVLPTSAGLGRFPQQIVSGPDGALWFSESNDQNIAIIGRMTLAGALTEFPLPSAFSGPMGIAVGSDGALWFTEFPGNRIGRITATGAITEFPLPNPGSGPDGITAGPDGAVWFTELTTIGRIGRISVPAAASPLVSAVLPTSRSVQVGNTATAFATIITAMSGRVRRSHDGEHRVAIAAAEHQVVPDRSAIGPMQLGRWTGRHLHDQHQCDADLRDFRDRKRCRAVRAADQPYLRPIQRRQRHRPRHDQRRRPDPMTPYTIVLFFSANCRAVRNTRPRYLVQVLFR